jgi:cell division protein FtsZ
MGIGVAGGENRAAEAAKAAISSPLLEASVEGATGILLNITGGSDMGLFEVNEAAEIIGSAADGDANIIFGAVIDEALGDQVRVTVIATGFDRNSPDRPAAAFASGGRREQAPRRPEPPADTRDTGQFTMPPDALEIPSFLRDE